MIWKLLIALAGLAILIGGIVWVSDGMNIYSKDREQVVKIIKDDLFGTTREEVSWIPAFKFGLLPGGTEVALIPGSYAFVLGISFSTIIGSFIMIRRSRKK